MSRKSVFLVVGLGLCVIAFEGCTVRTYTMRKDRVDQELSGNRGYLLGSKAEMASEKERPATRQVYVTEIEIGPKVKVESKPIAAPPATDKEIWGNQGYMREITPPEAEMQTPEIKPAAVQQYTVLKNDTLQKISQKFYGTTKKWQRIYEANKGVLKTPDRIYPGQVLNIPLEETQVLKEPQENLK